VPADPYRTPTDLRAEFPDLASTDLHPDARLEGLVAEFERKLEDDKGFAMVRRDVTAEPHRRTTAASSLVLNHVDVDIDTVELSINGTTLASARYDVDGPAGIIDFTSPVGPGNITAAYTHGPPAGEDLRPDVYRACGLYVLHEALAQANPNTSNSYLRQNELGVIERESTSDPDAGRLTGWIDVDRICRAIRSRSDTAVRG